MKTKERKETIHETFARVLCSNCRNRLKCQEELIRRLDNSIKCYKYVKDKDVEGYKKPLSTTAKQLKPIMKGIAK